MTTTISELRTAIATTLSGITGLRTSAFVPDTVSPPIAIIEPNSIKFDVSMGRGLDELNFKVTVIVGRATDRSAQSQIDAFCSSAGSTSVKQVLESNRTLGGKCNDLRVTGLNSYGSIQIADTPYLAAEFAVIVYAN
jgi:hypothetical protein